MNTDINGAGGIRVRIEALLAELPDAAELAVLPVHAELHEVARRLGEAHEALVAALDSVEKG